MWTSTGAGAARNLAFSGVITRSDAKLASRAAAPTVGTRLSASKSPGTMKSARVSRRDAGSGGVIGMSIAFPMVHLDESRRVGSEIDGDCGAERGESEVRRLDPLDRALDPDREALAE